MPAMVDAAIPSRNAEEQRNAARSRPRLAYWYAPQAPAIASATRAKAQGRAASPPKTSGRTQAVAVVDTTQSASAPFHPRRAKARLRSRTGPVVLHARYRAPWIARA